METKTIKKGATSVYSEVYYFSTFVKDHFWGSPLLLFNFCAGEMNKIYAKSILIIHTCKQMYGDLSPRHRNFAKKVLFWELFCSSQALCRLQKNANIIPIPQHIHGKSAKAFLFKMSSTNTFVKLSSLRQNLFLDQVWAQ